MSLVDKMQPATGSPAFEATASALRARVKSQLPASLMLPATLLTGIPAPLNVTTIPGSCGLLTPAELAITALDATALCEKMAARELSAVEVVSAFGKRAAIAHQVTACLTDFFLDEGIARAKELDEYLEREGKVIGPLHGLPISIKDHIPIKGHWGSGGFLSNTEISKDDCDMTRILRELGAVFYVKTNQPQTIMHLESQSCYGRTLNPHNTDLTPGGSSGGEAALIAMKGSPMGIGTDGGGSIRAPCAHCGLYGIRPTCKTMPMDGYLNSQDGADGVLPSTGPMCSSARDMRLLLSAILSARPASLDPSLYPVRLILPDLRSGFGRKLRVGLMMHDGVVFPHPPMLRALMLAKEKLATSDAVELMDYVPYEHDQGYSIARELYYEDGGKTLRRMLADGEENILPLSEWVISPPYVKDHDATAIWELHARRERFRRAYSDHWRSQGCDVVLCPPFPGVAARHDTSTYWGYTAIWNLVDYPGVVFPTGLTAEPSIDIAMEDSVVSISDADAYNRSLYEPTAFAGAPVSLQVIARRFEDGLVLAAQELIESILKG
ncbi:amidase [Coniophora puteana RWD-64-598 SS2]|uniref:amidase n=1 Tax=Coniophora puteana (strain RWD-64-598) TaxID=741705 RepID=A0A5M3MDH8_CONPW|nr:amidase [Coniophora puteana RWD-64-598 SS2]EIW77312.1 amidase [Coniophora puteana RWD-64-598 SS2]